MCQETLWRERKSKGELRSTFAVAFEKFPIEDSSDEEVCNVYIFIALVCMVDIDGSERLNRKKIHQSI